MNPKQAALLCLLSALLLSNLPFLGNRWFAWLSPRATRSIWMRIALWLLLYALWIAITIALESNLGKSQPKDWSVWAISMAFFAVLAFPGVTYRYLWHSKKRPEAAIMPNTPINERDYGEAHSKLHSP